MNNKSIIYIATIIIIVLIASAAFIYTNYNTTSNQTAAQNNITNQTAAQNNITLVDDEGYVTNLTAVPQRIISLAPSNTQIVFAIGAGNKVVGVTDYDHYPYNFTAWIAAGNMTSVGGFSTPNKETIASLHPDLILATSINDPDVVTLRNLGYKVLVLNPNNVTGVLQDISLVGRATGADQNATALVDTINNQISAITAKIAAANETKPLVYYEVWNDPLMSAGSTSFINDVIVKAGGQNIFGNETQQYPTVSSETIVQKNPDVILLPTDMANPGEAPFYGSVNQVKARPGWNAINAVKNNRVVVVDGDLFAEAGPRIGDQIDAAAKAFYPDLFNSTT
ncbi:MAG: cobalamin-binding protein [Candidatus Bathyarchaeia archaeon]|jgi:iron complex transport system substrate-binding protein